MNKLFRYNFNGEIYETSNAFDEVYYIKSKEIKASGKSMSRQVITGNEIINEVYYNGVWLPDYIVAKSDKN